LTLISQSLIYHNKFIIKREVKNDPFRRQDNLTMLSPEILSKIRQFHFVARKKAGDIFAGAYESAFKGRGMEFSEVREYMPGDDVRTIDWNVSARMGHPFVKVFNEERELTVMLLLDISGSQLFGTRVKFKRELLAELAGMLAFIAMRNNDRVGAILFSRKVEKFIPPRKGAAHVWKLIKEIFTLRPESLATDVESALHYLNMVSRRHSIVFLVSDTCELSVRESLAITARRHTLSVLRISDPAEEDIPNVGIVSFRDPETGEIVRINTGSARLRQEWREKRAAESRAFADMLAGAGIDYAVFSTDEPPDRSLVRLFRQKAHRLSV
jgi:uncharacterized protein (DUF58 family)